jgi:tetratricopeptide (TPR) repeat protein
VRALANLGISYSNQELFDEAASCYLKALSMNPEAMHIWSSLRVVFNCLNRPDLAEKTELKNTEVFRGQFDF